MLANRLRKRMRHLRRWPARGVPCFRVYERDLPDQPLVVDWYDGEAVVWAYERKRDETPEQDAAWIESARAAVAEGLDVPHERIFWKRRRRQRGRSRGGGQYDRLATSGHVRVVPEQGLRFEVNLSDYLDTGLFLDHRNTRAAVREMAAGTRFLNLFAYTGSFTCYAAAGGAASTLTVDLSATYCDWAGRNMRLNGFAPEDGHEIVRADVLAYLRDAVKAPRRFDLIVCDPPTFSNSKSFDGEFSVVRDHVHLIRVCHNLLDPGGTLFFSSNARGFDLDEADLPPFDTRETTPGSIPEDFRNRRVHRCWRMRKPA